MNPLPFDRRSFFRLGAAAAGASFLGSCAALRPGAAVVRPVVLSTWDHGHPANAAALEVLARGGSALDAAEAGARVVESQCPDRSVGLMGMPDRTGAVTLDAAVMTDDGRAGAVAFVQGIEHPVSVARMVMERTPHVMLAGAGAEAFAVSQGVPVAKRPLDAAQQEALAQWRAKQSAPPSGPDNHDTITILVLDGNGIMAGASTTSGVAFKMHGRIGDSPILGAGIYVEANVGGAVCTGLGETVMRTLGAHAAVELMRQGMSPQEACEAAIRRLIQRNREPATSYQVGMLALDHQGRAGAFAVQKGFRYALARGTENVMHDAAHAATP